MLRKILKVFLVIVFIGFISAYVRGIHYNSNKLKSDKLVAQENIETEKQNIIDEELISSIINDNESKEETKENNTSNNKVINNKNEEIKNTIPEQKQESNQNEEKQINNISNKNLSYTMIEYYTLIAMACLYGSMLSMYITNFKLADRKSVV